MKIGWLFLHLISAFLVCSPALAARLESWRFDTRSNRLDFVLDERIQPNAQLIANPSRVVIDLPGTILGRPKVNRPIGQQVAAIRVAQTNPSTTRIVIELAPGYTVDPQRIAVRGESPTRWFIELPQFLPTPVVPEDAVGALIPQPVQVLAVPDNRFKGTLTLREPFSQLLQQVTLLKAKYPDLQTGMFFLDLDTGNYLDLGGDKVFPAASVIKLPILIAFFQDVDAGKIRLDEQLVMRPDLVAPGSGDMQDMPRWRKFSALETATKMITISDNTATNMIIDRMGGIAVLNQRFRRWGMEQTVIRNLLADLSGTNTTSARDLVYVLGLLDRNQLVSPVIQEQVLGILRRASTKTLLPAGLGPGAVIAHKTGDIGFAIGDAGIIKMPNGKRYLAAVLLRRPYNDPRGRNFIRQVSQIIYTYLNQGERQANDGVQVRF